MRSFDTLVSGSGLAGLAAAAAAGRCGRRVLLAEQRERYGSKLLLSGGGRCNITNILSAREQAEKCGVKSRFMLPALYNLPPEKMLEFFAERQLEMELTDGFHYFPRSGRASDVLKVMLEECRLLGVECRSKTRVTELKAAGDHLEGAVCGGKFMQISHLVVANGGMSYPKLGGICAPYALAEQAGHTIVTPRPAMTGLHCREEWCGQCTGISLEDAEVRIDLPGEKMKCRGELLFTHQGISAFAVLDMTGYIGELLETYPEVPLKVNLFAGNSAGEWQERFREWQQKQGSCRLEKLLTSFMPRRLIPFICPAAETPAARYPGELRKQLIENLTALPLHINGTDGWDKAMVTRGGVALDEVNPKTLESRLLKGLYFAGEVLDIDGPCGGYNLQWAFSSGYLAGECRS